MENKKIAVLFPGVGYHCDKPLLYYSRKLAIQKGYEVKNINYDLSILYKDVKNNRDAMKEACEAATKSALEQLSEVEFSDYEEVVFIGKSLGTVVAGFCDEKLNINAKHIILTPIPETFEHLKKGCGIVFHGTSDPACENDIVREKCRELDLELVEVEGANHSLELMEVMPDLGNIEMVMERIWEEM